MLYPVNTTSQTFRRTTTDTSKTSLMIRNEGAYPINFTLTENGSTTSFSLNPDAQVFLAIREDSLSAVSSGNTAFRTYKVTAKGVDECDINGIVPSDAVAEEVKELEKNLADVKNVVSGGAVTGLDINGGLKAFNVNESIYSYGEDTETPFNDRKMTIIVNATGKNQQIFSYVEAVNDSTAAFSIKITAGGLITYSAKPSEYSYEDARVQSSIIPQEGDQLAFVYDAGIFKFYVNGVLGASAEMPADEGNVFITSGIKIQYNMLDSQKLKYFIWDEYRAWSPDDGLFGFNDLLAGKTIPDTYLKDSSSKDIALSNFTTTDAITATNTTASASASYGTETGLIKIIPKTGNYARDCRLSKTNYKAVSNAVVQVKGYFPASNEHWKYCNISVGNGKVISTQLDDNFCFAAEGAFDLTFTVAGTSNVASLPIYFNFRSTSGRVSERQNITSTTQDVFYISEISITHTKGVVQYIQAPTYANVWKQLGTYEYDLVSYSEVSKPIVDSAKQIFLTKTITLNLTNGVAYADDFGVYGRFRLHAVIFEDCVWDMSSTGPAYLVINVDGTPAATGEIPVGAFIGGYYQNFSLPGVSSTIGSFLDSSLNTYLYGNSVDTSATAKVTLVLERV